METYYNYYYYIICLKVENHETIPLIILQNVFSAPKMTRMLIVGQFPTVLLILAIEKPFILLLATLWKNY